MKKLLFLSAIIFLSLKLNAQTFTTREDNSSVSNKVDTDPAFPGGFTAFDRYIDLNADKVLKNDHALGIVVVKFLVEKNGNVTGAEVIKGLTPETDFAAVFFLTNSPPWKPGIKNDMAVKTMVKVGIKFRDALYTQIIDIQNVILSSEPIESPKVTEEVDPNHVFTSVEKIPEYPGGVTKFFQFIKDNQKVKVGSNGESGKVFVSFIVEKDGSLSDIKVIRGLSQDYDAEALRLLKLMPKWIPGMQNGRPVRVQYSVPITFKLND